MKHQILHKKNTRKEVRKTENDKVKKKADMFCALKNIQSEIKDRP
jgi:hypothetical protein